MENNKIKDKIDDLVESLNRASKAYYNGADEIMPNYEWDALFDELTQLEKRQDISVRTVRHRMQAMRQRLEIVSHMSIRHFHLQRQRALRSLRNGQAICQYGFHGSLTV